jgi:hypothetical protein
MVNADCAQSRSAEHVKNKPINENPSARTNRTIRNGHFISFLPAPGVAYVEWPEGNPLRIPPSDLAGNTAMHEQCNGGALVLQLAN